LIYVQDEVIPDVLQEIEVQSTPAVQIQVAEKAADVSPESPIPTSSGGLSVMRDTNLLSFNIQEETLDEVCKLNKAVQIKISKMNVLLI
jgi:hypothetical protein